MSKFLMHYQKLKVILEERLTEHDLEELMELDNEVEMTGGNQFLTIVKSNVL